MAEELARLVAEHGPDFRDAPVEWPFAASAEACSLATPDAVREFAAAAEVGDAAVLLSWLCGTEECQSWVAAAALLDALQPEQRAAAAADAEALLTEWQVSERTGFRAFLRRARGVPLLTDEERLNALVSQLDDDQIGNIVHMTSSPHQAATLHNYYQSLHVVDADDVEPKSLEWLRRVYVLTVGADGRARAAATTVTKPARFPEATQ